MSEQAADSSKDPSAPSETQAATNEPSTATAATTSDSVQLGQESAAPSAASSAAAASGATNDAASGATNPDSASANTTNADLSNLTQTIGGGAKTSSSGPSATTPTANGGQETSAASEKVTSIKSHKSSTGQGASKSTTHATSATNSSPSASPSSAAASSRGRKRMKLGELDLSTARIGFLGAGKMAESTINGLIHYAKISPKRIHVAAPSSKGLERFKALGCRVTKRNYDIFGRYDCDIVFLCFHGYVIKHCYRLGGARPHPLTTNYIPHQRHPVYILSLVSGVSLTQIKACLLNPESNNRYVVEIHRIMMNTAVGHGLGICAVDCEPDSKKLSPPLRQMLSAIAQLEHVPASQMDAACAVGGSGLAFSYYFINSLADGAFKMGLSRQQAIRFASKTAQCAAQTMLESGKHPAELRDNVSSPSGAAIYGIHVLEKNDVASGVTAAVEAAHKRANDLATQDIVN